MAALPPLAAVEPVLPAIAGALVPAVTLPVLLDGLPAFALTALPLVPATEAALPPVVGEVVAELEPAIEPTGDMSEALLPPQPAPKHSVTMHKMCSVFIAEPFT
jgi:hypothetical protein